MKNKSNTELKSVGTNVETVRDEGGLNTIPFLTRSPEFSGTGQRAFGHVQHSYPHTDPLNTHTHTHTNTDSEIN